MSCIAVRISGVRTPTNFALNAGTAVAWAGSICPCAVDYLRRRLDMEQLALFNKAEATIIVRRSGDGQTSRSVAMERSAEGVEATKIN